MNKRSPVLLGFGGRERIATERGMLTMYGHERYFQLKTRERSDRKVVTSEKGGESGEIDRSNSSVHEPRAAKED